MALQGLADSKVSLLACVGIVHSKDVTQRSRRVPLARVRLVDRSSGTSTSHADLMTMITVGRSTC